MWASQVADLGRTGLVATAPNGPYAAGSTPVYGGQGTAQIVDGNGNGIPAAALTSLTLSIVDTLSGAVINGAQAVNILNTGRGAVDDQGFLTIALLPGDTSLSEVNTPSIQRSLVIDWTYGAGLVGRHQVNFQVVALAGA